jgi:(2Fe-2S) ferredoxin
VQNPYFDIHIFCCTNRRSAEHELGSCAALGAEALRDYMKEKAKILAGPGKKIRVNTAGCLDRCAQGPVMVIYPEAVWYQYRTRQDIDMILSEHVGQGKIVESLRI